MPDPQVKVSNSGPLRCEVEVRGHRLTADEPADRGGEDAGPTPTEIFLAGLASCTAMTLRMYAERKGWPVGRIEVAGESAWVTREEWEDWPEGEERKRIPRLLLRIRLEGDLTAEQVERLRYIAGRCPVHRIVTEHPATVRELLPDSPPP